MIKQTISSVGVIENRTSYSIIHLNYKYKKALNKLDLFSHILIFSGHDKSIFCNITNVITVMPDKGIVVTSPINQNDNTIVYDIKPYFPCEDRVSSEKSSQDFVAEFDKSDIKNIGKNVIIPDKDIKINFIGQYEYHNGQQIKLDNEFELQRFADNEYIRILWWFDRFDKPDMRRTLEVNPPYENAPKSGVFATRSPVRPNLLASTVVKINSIDVENNTICIDGYDGFEGTKIIDLLPYDKEKDNIENWYIPSYLMHWPEYKHFEDQTHFTDNQRLKQSDLDLLINFIGQDHISKAQDEHSSKANYKKGYISIIGANENNLKNVNAIIPKNKMTVVTGVSGSGKSSLVFDTLYKESQHQYMDIMGGAENNVVSKPDVKEVTGLMPAVSISQKAIFRNPRSTVGTLTKLSTKLRQLYSLIGTRHCPCCLKPIKVISEGEILELLNELSKISFLKIFPFGMQELSRAYNNDNGLVFDYLSKGNGAIEVVLDGNSYLLQTKQYCFHCERIFFDMSPSMFSSNSPEHMCPQCKGMGEILLPSEDRIVHNPDISILDGASKLWGNLRSFRDKPNANWMKGQVLAAAADMGVDLELPYKDLPFEFRDVLMNGSNGKEVSLEYNKGGRAGVITRPVEGAINIVKRLLQNTSSTTNIGMAEGFLTRTKCEKCNGERLVLESRLVTVDSLRYPESLNMSITSLHDWIQDLSQKLPAHKLLLVKNLLDDMQNGLQKLEDLGLSYLTLDRSVTTISGGEGQRIKLSCQFNNQLTSILYILDEPTIGLHSKDYLTLIDTLKSLCKKDNTVVVVEHKKDVMLCADYIIDVGRGAGKYGGEIIACGDIDEIANNPKSITGKYLKANTIDIKKEYFELDKNNTILIKGVKTHNIKNIDAPFPKTCFTCVTGVSGSGKSSLVSSTLASAVMKKLGKSGDSDCNFESISGHENIKDVINITQSAIGRTPRSTPATYTGVFDHIRDVFAKTDTAKEKNYKKEHFSFNGKQGTCTVCGGMGKIQHKMGFMDDIWTLCPICKGKRFKKEVLDITYNGYNISEVLNMEIREALDVFENNKKISDILNTLNDIGLGYIKLGQSAMTLSGGEAQRIKLAAGLSKSSSGGCLYILDEPTTGLHYNDLKKLLEIIKRLAQKNTVIVIEHNIEFISNADYIIDMGPSGGAKGGNIIASGSPYQIINDENSITGKTITNSII